MRSIYIKSFYLFCWLAILMILVSTAAWIIFLLYRGFSGLNAELFFGSIPAWKAIIDQSPVWDGIWPAFVGTLTLVCLTMILAIIPGIGCGIFLSEYASPRQRYWGRMMIDMLAGMPSIVMGLFGFLLILLLRRTFWPEANTGLLLAASCLALLVLPVIIVTTIEALRAIPSHVRITTASLGIRKWAQIRHLLLPIASKGILGGVILAIGRSAEDMAVIMLTGAVASSGLSSGLTGKFEALPFHIYITAAEYQSVEKLNRGFSTSLVLLALSTFLLLCAALLEHAYKKRWHHG